MTTLTDQEKRGLIEARLRSFALDSFGHELNRAAAIAADDTEAVTAADLALVAIATTTAAYETELASLEPTPGEVD
jgi:hypothetical protein